MKNDGRVENEFHAVGVEFVHLERVSNESWNLILDWHDGKQVILDIASLDKVCVRVVEENNDTKMDK